MKSMNLKMTAAVLSCLGMLVSPVAAATPGVAPRDIALHQGGVLVGQIVDAKGVSIAKAQVSLFSAGKEVARTQSDSTGNFAVKGLKGGVYQVASENNQGVYRLWSAQTAPPSAQRGMMLVSDTDIALGQGGQAGPFRGVANWVSQHPIMTAGVIATAIAIPIALDDDDDPPATP